MMLDEKLYAESRRASTPYLAAMASDLAFKRRMARVHPEMVREYLKKHPGYCRARADELKPEAKQKPKSESDVLRDWLDVASKPRHVSQYKGNLSRSVAWETIVASAFTHGIHPDDVMTRKRNKNILRARFAAYWSLNREGYSLAAIGRALDRDHTSIRYGVKQYEKWLAEMHQPDGSIYGTERTPVNG